MAVEWQFYRQSPTDPILNPTGAEFFSTEAVGNVAEALVREVIQNSLDARLRRPDGSRQMARVRIYVSGADGRLPASRARRWFESLWPHVMAPRNGLNNQPEPLADCPFLVCEDFGTIGLTGDPGAFQLVEGVPNHFLNFFRAEGHSDKGGHDRGSWGVGKMVYPRTSRIGSFLALTVRSDDQRRLLLGRSLLKYHAVSGRAYKSDGYFGERRHDGLVLPSEDSSLIADFCEDFRLKRDGESGLSVVVPWYDVDGDDAVDERAVTAAVLRGFFYPILMGDLAVTIGTPAGEVTYDAGSIMANVQLLGGELKTELLPLVELAEWARTLLPTEFRVLRAPSPTTAQTWAPELVPEDVVSAIRQSLSQHERIAIRVPMSVQPRTTGPVSTFFSVFLEHTEENNQKPVFIRDELIIPDVRPPRMPQLRSLVIVDDAPLANLLRDAETPAHTQWSSDTSNFKNKYKVGPSAIRFVRFSVSEIIRMINQADEEADPSITINYFSIPAPADDGVNVPAPRPRPVPDDGPPPPPPPPPPPRPRRFRIEKVRGGFAIRAGDPEAPLPAFIDIRVAYDVRRGNPLKRYNAADFDLSRAPVRMENVSGVEVERVAGNRMRLAVKEAAFSLDVRGFDPDRDLYVRAEAGEAADPTEATDGD